MKKLVVVLLDGTIIETDLQIDIVGVPSTHPSLIELAQNIAASGIIDERHTTADRLEFIPPSQIKHVRIVPVEVPPSSKIIIP